MAYVTTIESMLVSTLKWLPYKQNVRPKVDQRPTQNGNKIILLFGVCGIMLISPCSSFIIFDVSPRPEVRLDSFMEVNVPLPTGGCHHYAGRVLGSAVPGSRGRRSWSTVSQYVTNLGSKAMIWQLRWTIDVPGHFEGYSAVFRCS